MSMVDVGLEFTGTLHGIKTLMLGNYALNENMIWISKNLAIKVSEVELLPKTFFDDNTISLVYKRTFSSF